LDLAKLPAADTGGAWICMDEGRSSITTLKGGLTVELAHILIGFNFNRKSKGIINFYFQPYFFEINFTSSTWLNKPMSRYL
jgi:hypothetical protein